MALFCEIVNYDTSFHYFNEFAFVMFTCNTSFSVELTATDVFKSAKTVANGKSFSTIVEAFFLK
jgi:hypothetical protein